MMNSMCEFCGINQTIISNSLLKLPGELKDGVTIQRVLDDVRDYGNPENFERVHFLQNDIHNIIRDYSIG